MVTGSCREQSAARHSSDVHASGAPSRASAGSFLSFAAGVRHGLVAKGVDVDIFSENTQDAEYARLHRRAFPDAILQPIDMRVTGVVSEARVRLFGGSGHFIPVLRYLAFLPLVDVPASDVVPGWVAGRDAVRSTAASAEERGWSDVGRPCPTLTRANHVRIASMKQ